MVPLNSTSRPADIYGLQRFLFLIDRERLSKGNSKPNPDEVTILKRYLSEELKAKISSIEVLLPGTVISLRGRFSRGSFDLKVVILGEVKSLNEHIERLRILKAGTGALPASEAKLIEISLGEELEEALPGLTLALKQIEEDP